MATYTPDCWEVILVTSSKHGRIYKILASWYGGYTGSSKWKISSGIEKIIEHDDHYEMLQSSGSVYLCGKSSRNLSSLSASILNLLKHQLAEAGTGDSVEVVQTEITSLELTS